MSAAERAELIAAYVGERRTAGTGPGRAFERTDYRFDIVSDYGAFRDLQRHRMLTIEWQPLTTDLGYEVPEVVDEAGLATASPSPSSAPASCTAPSPSTSPSRRAYAVALAFKIRYVDADERPRGDAPHRAAARAPRATRSYRVIRTADAHSDPLSRPAIGASLRRCASLTTARWSSGASMQNSAFPCAKWRAGRPQGPYIVARWRAVSDFAQLPLTPGDPRVMNRGSRFGASVSRS